MPKLNKILAFFIFIKNNRCIMKLKPLLKESLIDKILEKIIYLTLTGKSNKLQNAIKNNPELEKVQQRLDADLELYKKHLSKINIDHEDFLKTFFNA